MDWKGQRLSFLCYSECLSDKERGTPFFFLAFGISFK
uniref:Uncharacterized protein n=1 Tax=Rhizophora mucronata TaxID=61149 RepID=A0A2P2KV45_RHIMU